MKQALIPTRGKTEKWGSALHKCKGNETNLLFSKASGCFKFMVMTAATGDPLFCICILAATSLGVTDLKGFDYRASIQYDSIKTTEENMVEGKALPRLPV